MAEPNRLRLTPPSAQSLQRLHRPQGPATIRTPHPKFMNSAAFSNVDAPHNCQGEAQKHIVDTLVQMWTPAHEKSSFSPTSLTGVSHDVLRASCLLTRLQQAVREPLSGAPRDYKGFAVYIFERTRQIDHGRALPQTLEKQGAQAP